MDETNKKAHITELEKTANDFAQLSQDWAHQHNDAINFFGAVIDNTAASVLSAYNALSDTPKRLLFTHHSNWFNYMATIHSNFFTNLVAHSEESIKIFCNENNLPISNKRERFEAQLKRTYGDAPVNTRQYKKLQSYVSSTPEFMDYVEGALVVLSEDRRLYWRNRFLAINLLRNKSSHSNSELTANQIVILINGGFGDQANKQGIRFNTSLYKPLVEDCMEFLKELQASTPK